jgi:homoserine/homoserine lactone efflux protein
MNPNLFAAFLLAVTILILMPGPIVTLVIANSLSRGTRIGLVTVAGASTGNALLITAGAVGLSTLFALLSEAFEVFRWLGAAYLIWLACEPGVCAQAPAIPPLLPPRRAGHVPCSCKGC